MILQDLDFLLILCVMITLCVCVCVLGLSSSECWQQLKASCFSVNWTAGDEQLEVINASTGKRRDCGAPSRLCKRALFTRWNRVYRKVRAAPPNPPSLTPNPHTHTHQSRGLAGIEVEFFICDQMKLSGCAEILTRPSSI